MSACSWASCQNCGRCSAAWERDDEDADDVESPFERMAQSASSAVEDLDAAIWQATTRRELQCVRALAESLIQRLEATASTALTLDEQFDEMRRR